MTRSPENRKRVQESMNRQIKDLEGHYKLECERIKAAYPECDIPRLLQRALGAGITDLWIVAAMLWGKPVPNGQTEG